MPNVNLSPLDAQQAALNRRRALALALQQQSMEPIASPPVRGAQISPVEGIAKLAQALVGNLSNRRLDKEQATLSDQQQQQRESQAGSLVASLTPPAQGDVVQPDNSGLPLPQLGPQPQQLNPAPQQLDARTQSIKALAAALASQDPMMQKSGEAGLQNLMVSGRDGETQRQEMARLLAGQKFTGSQNDLNRGLTQQQIEIQRQLANQKEIQKPIIANTGRAEKTTILDPNTLKTVQTIEGNPVEPATRNPVSATITKLGADGKPHIFRQDGATGAFSIDEGVAYEKPPSANPSNTADSTSYKFHVAEIDKRAKPLDDAATRFSRLQDTINQGTAQADALVAPELMTVMAGGSGSGLRINEAEINRVQGGRPMVAQIEAKLRKWMGTDQKSAIDFGPQERKAINDLLGIVGSKLQQKQKALTDASAVVSGESTTDQQRRKALADLDSNLRDIDSGKVQGGTDLGATLDKLFGPAPKAK